MEPPTEPRLNYSDTSGTDASGTEKEINLDTMSESRESIPSAVEENKTVAQSTAALIDDEPDTCPICLDDLIQDHNYCMTDCKHAFHATCLQKVKKCPMCRTPFTNSALPFSASLLRFPLDIIGEPGPPGPPGIAGIQEIARADSPEPEEEFYSMMDRLGAFLDLVDSDEPMLLPSSVPEGIPEQSRQRIVRTLRNEIINNRYNTIMNHRDDHNIIIYYNRNV